ncbi:MAG TPA: DUF4129 domain-containing protein [Solirubrobacteraceae bacterium]|nr:DUF4129 domain-containing protein [Solirubrobacteraceae bacterium]
MRRPLRALPASVAAVTVLLLCGLVALTSRGGLHGKLLGGKYRLQTRTQKLRLGHVTRSGGGLSLTVQHWIGWTALGLVAALLLALILRHLPSLRITRRSWGSAGAEEDVADFDLAPTVSEEESSARQAALRDAVLRSLDEIRRDPDARRAIIGAYRLMEAALARTGLPRDPAEAPREYLSRALSSLDVGPQAPRRLTALFERARFGDADLDLSLRDQAVDALLELQGAL